MVFFFGIGRFSTLNINIYFFITGIYFITTAIIQDLIYLKFYFSLLIYTYITPLKSQQLFNLETYLIMFFPMECYLSLC